jgi:nucleotide-binding universal stress UspA family protein
MYDRILLAYDGSLEGRAALREGAVIALRFRAHVTLLSVIAPSVGMEVAEGAHPGPAARREAHYRSILAEGVARIRALNLPVSAEMVFGDPAKEISACARRIRADLVVVGHRKKTLIERWWSGPSGAYLSDSLTCSLLLSRNAMSDDDFETALQKAKAAYARTER